MLEVSVRKHSTANHIFYLYDGDTVVDLTGLKIHLVLLKTGADVDYNTTDDAGNLAITDATTGEVTFTPSGSEWDSDDRVESFFWVENGTTFKEYPPGEEIVFIIRDVGSYDPTV